MVAWINSDGKASVEDSAYGVSLFERLETDAPKRSITYGPAPDDVIESIKRSISRLLNTRVGESLSAPELGLIDFNDASLGAHDLAVQIKRAIKQCLYRYEPRIKSLDIHYFNDEFAPLNLRFEIIADINTGALHQQVQIDLVLDSNKQFRGI